ncbi:MAG: class I SAM-dependent methyltransferase [Anaerolineae bacterium]|nr:class I SAM-dependent methyltransferase [Thermoflexales bacterium]MDW8395935.1 class I SAM-dependent methyltransferase [Anaerolineae bacterium]
MSACCDYEGSDYRVRFWQNADRAYEDAVERVALRRLLPSSGKRLIELGAGFGRLADLYAGYEEVVLLDYARSMLHDAIARWGSDPRFRFVVADVYRLPFAAGAFDAATMIRVVHHLADVPAALEQIRRVLAEGGTFVLEFANKRNLKAMLRHALRRQPWSPYTPEPVEFVALHFDFHPRWMQLQAQQAGFVVQSALPVSFLRLNLLKRILPLSLMVSLDAMLQRAGQRALFAPSVFLSLRAGVRQPAARLPPCESIFRSPISGAPVRREGDWLISDQDKVRWRVEGALYDFKSPEPL